MHQSYERKAMLCERQFIGEAMLMEGNSEDRQHLWKANHGRENAYRRKFIGEVTLLEGHSKERQCLCKAIHRRGSTYRRQFIGEATLMVGGR